MKKRGRFRSLATLALLLGLLVTMPGGARAQLPVARLVSLFPPGGRIGTTFEVTASGTDLDEPSGLRFTHPGLSAVARDGADKFTITIASNTPPGVYEARFAGRFGLSNPRAFVVGDLPEIVAPQTNTSTASALELPLDTTVSSRLSPNGVAWFKFNAKKGRRILMECLAESLDSRLDAALVVTDSTGRELERQRQGGLLDFTAPADGGYGLKVADFLYRGGGDYFYRLTLSTRPRLDFIFPPAALPGTKTNFTLYGRNLPGGQTVRGQTMDGKRLEQLTVEIAFPTNESAPRRLDTGLLVRPAGAVLDGFDFFEQRLL